MVHGLASIKQEHSSKLCGVSGGGGRKNFRGLSSQANYTDRATAACQRS
jgi:hypothetical protein